MSDPIPSHDLSTGHAALGEELEHLELEEPQDVPVSSFATPDAASVERLGRFLSEDDPFNGTFNRQSRSARSNQQAHVDEADPDEFMSVKSTQTRTTFYTAPLPAGSTSNNKALTSDSKYAQLLAGRKLWPVDPAFEQDWSGRGQHVEFSRDERDVVNSILKVRDVLGKTAIATVESVKCRRILLARKTILCKRRSMTKEDAIKEVSHLSSLKHSHIVRVIGTYVLGQELSILLYPVADYNLDDYLRTIIDGHSEHVIIMMESGRYFFACLSSALKYIHAQNVKHMDIKPQNILVRRVKSGYRDRYKVYIADFGIAKAYTNEESAETDGWTPFTRKYAAPEVVQQETRGFSADVFSLGCVFLELFAVLEDAHVRWRHSITVFSEVFDDDVSEPPRRKEELYELIEHELKRDSNRTLSYHAHIESLQNIIRTSDIRGFHTELSYYDASHLEFIASMISEDRHDRPSSAKCHEAFCVKSHKTDHFYTQKCCFAGQDKLEAFKTQIVGLADSSSEGE